MHGGNKEIIKITGMVKNIIFRNKENGYTVFRIKIIDDRHFGEFVCNGYFAAIYPGEIMDLNGFFFYA